MDSVRGDERDHVLRITLARPPLNVLDIPTIRALSSLLRPLAKRPDLRLLVLRSEGDAFCAGVDVADHARGRVSEMLAAFHELFRLIDALPQVTLAAVDGHCLGGGCELAAFCDVLLATPRSRFALPEIDVGCFPPVAAVLLPRLVGRAAFEMVLTGAPIGADEAARLGLVTRVVEDLEAETQSWADRLAGKSGAALALARKALRHGAYGDFAEALARTEAIYHSELLSTLDVDEGVRAFLEKRPPRWSHR